MSASESFDAVAVLAMAGRFPGAADIEELWANLCAGRESVSRFDDAELAAAGVAADLRRDRRYVPARGVVDGIEDFDAGLFGMTPRQAELTAPQFRLFFECAWEALESGGYGAPAADLRVGVFGGVGANAYLIRHLLGHGLLDGAEARQVALGNDPDHLATRVAYHLDLRGPALTVQTACSTSLVAVHLGCQSLLAGECDLALAGGASVALPQRAGYLAEDGGILSPDGRCRPFDAAARGTVFGNGAAVVLLKRLSGAVADGDPVHAVLRGTAVNNDGAARVGYTAPGVDGQAEVIAEALAVAGVEPATIGLVEAHGTGTELGDPIEVRALNRAFGAATGRTGCCALGSIKGNLGHLDAAAGVAGLIKAVLAVEHGVVPPSLHFTRPNPEIELAGSPWTVAAETRPWPAADGPRRAAVSAFGIGGTNAHAVIEQAPPRPPAEAAREWQLLVLSARSEPALAAAGERLARHLRRHPDVALADVAHTLRVGRRVFAHRRALVCRDAEAATAALAEDPGGRRGGPAAAGVAGVAGRSAPPVVFLFPGQGVQHPGMGRGVYHAEPVFRDAVDRACEVLEPRLGLDLRPVLYPPPERAAEAAERLRETELAQPALFVVEHALARLWLDWGVRPRAMFGHSLGEYVAACLAGVLSLDDALALVAARGRLMQESPRGAMLAVALGGAAAAELVEEAGEELSLAAVNAGDRAVVAGSEAAVARLEAELTRRRVEHRRLATSHAFHSHLVEPVLGAFAAEVAKVALAPPEIPFLSSLSGDWVQPEEVTDPGYWVRHLRATVRCDEALRRLVSRPPAVLLEVGPGRTLGALASRQPERTEAVLAVASLPGPGRRPAAAARLLAAAGRLWCAGVDLDWQAFAAPERRRRERLPAYPFERRRHWVEPPAGAAAAAPAGDARPAAPAAAGESPAPAAADGSGDRLVRLIEQQLAVVAGQLSLLTGGAPRAGDADV